MRIATAGDSQCLRAETWPDVAEVWIITVCVTAVIIACIYYRSRN